MFFLPEDEVQEFVVTPKTSRFSQDRYHLTVNQTAEFAKGTERLMTPSQWLLQVTWLLEASWLLELLILSSIGSLSCPLPSRTASCNITAQLLPAISLPISGLSRRLRCFVCTFLCLASQPCMPAFVENFRWLQVPWVQRSCVRQSCKKSWLP